MEISHVESLLVFITRMFMFFYFIVAVTPVISTVQISKHRHPHLSNASDQEALLEFTNSITYDPSHSLITTWKPNVSFCEWRGVICSRRRQRVVSLNVSDMGLQGTISPLLGNLSFLTILDLSNNSFHGQIPYQLGNLFRLSTLYLYLNQIQGSIPPTLCGCRSLRLLSMAINYLTGTIPGCLGNISSLEYINLGSNHLHGRVPSELGMLSQASVIILHNNSFTGQIPSSFSNCTNLLALDLTLNQLTGRIPADLCSKNTQLTELYLSRNQLSGSIPTPFFNCTNFQIIDLSHNQLSGVMPVEFGKLTQLVYLVIGVNQLVSGNTMSLPIVTALTNCSSLKNVDLDLNYLTGHLPASIGLLSRSLNFLNLDGNKLSGSIPPEIGNLTGLGALDIGYNLFTGAIPSSLMMLQKLERLYMGGNSLKENIPAEIGQLQSLGLLAIEDNSLSGRIPNSIGSLQQLRYLYLYKNQLSGKIPANLGKCVNLLTLDLSYNRLSGYIPPEVAGLANYALYFNLSNNLLHGHMPLTLSKMTMVQAIDISANQLTGYIPSALQSCKELNYLNLSYNALEGSIPVSLGKLESLEDIDLSFNNLSGGIPMSLENLKMLNHLNFSFNKLSGEVPKEGVFKKINATAFMGNIRLCGPWVSLPPCSAHKHQRVWHIKIVIILIVVVAVIVVSCLLLVILWNQNRKRHTLREIHTSLIAGHRRISYGEILTATNEFSDANLLGVGSFGKVYKGILNDGTLVAIKVLDLENEGAQKSFEKECKVLGKVRHRNLIRIITSYSDVQMKALIFPFMPNGSLEKWLYPDGEEESRLSLFERMNIGLDIAQGMAYLHHYCFMQVIHCDLKPSNILLGEDMTSYLIDFGIATICFPSSKDLALTSTHALKGSVGYIPPEYGLGGPVTIKGDVYSYGIVLLEMLTRKKPNHNMFVEGPSLQKWVGCNFPNRVGEVVDKSLLRRTSTSIEEVKELNCLMKLISVGLLCTRESPEERPTMINIVTALQSIKDTFLGIVGNPILQSDITSLLGNTSIAHNNTGESQSSSTF